ncbi:Dabb family protein [bacterium]|nr:Dabb family protein [bacterium]
MVKHVVMFKLKKEAEGMPKAVNVEKFRAKLEKLKDHISSLLSCEVGVNISDQPTSYDIVLNTEFRSLADLETYRDHPEHQKVVAYINTICENRAVVDFIL